MQAVVKELETLIWAYTGHSNSATAATQSTFGRKIALGCEDGTVKLWNLKMWQLEQILAGHRLGVSSVAFSPNGQCIASGSWDKTISVWDAETGRIEQNIAGHLDWIRAVAFSPDGRQVASGSDDETVKIWDVNTGEIHKTLAGHSSWIRAVAFSPDGRWVASISDDNTLRVWDPQNSSEQYRASYTLDRIALELAISQAQDHYSASNTVERWASSTSNFWGVAKCAAVAAAALHRCLRFVARKTSLPNAISLSHIHASVIAPEHDLPPVDPNYIIDNPRLSSQARD